LIFFLPLQVSSAFYTGIGNLWPSFDHVAATICAIRGLTPMDKIKNQANVVSQLVFSSETSDTFRKTLLTTWKILRETGILIWLVLCLTFVGGEWFYRTSVSLGRNARVWYNHLGEKADSSDPTEAASSIGEAVLDTVKTGTSSLLSQARQQLGMKEPAPMPPPAPKAAKPSPVVEPATTPAAEPVAMTGEAKLDSSDAPADEES
jgi:hypothetical protein